MAEDQAKKTVNCPMHGNPLALVRNGKGDKFEAICNCATMVVENRWKGQAVYSEPAADYDPADDIPGHNQDVPLDFLVDANGKPLPPSDEAPADDDPPADEAPVDEAKDPEISTADLITKAGQDTKNVKPANGKKKPAKKKKKE